MRLTDLENYNYRWQKRNFSRLMAIATGVLAAVVLILENL